MPLETPARIVGELASRGLNADREAVTLLANAPDPERALEAAVEASDDATFKLTAADVRSVLEADPVDDPTTSSGGPADGTVADPESAAPEADPGRTEAAESSGGATTAATAAAAPQESTDGTAAPDHARTAVPDEDTAEAGTPDGANRSREHRTLAVAGDVTGESVGTGTYDDFVAIFRDRYDRLSRKLRGRVNHRPAEAIEDLPGGTEVEMIGMVDDVRSTKNGHTLVDLEDPTGTFPWLVVSGREIDELTDELLCDEVVAMSGTLSDDAGIAFADAIHFPDVPRTYEPSTADRHVQAALISDVHVGSQEFRADAWERFARWLHTSEAEPVEYLLIAGDMVEGVGVYPEQDAELDIVDIYDQYEAFAEHLKAVPGDIDVVMIPGNHDAVRLAEPQPGFDEELREVMAVHDARVVGNPSTVTLEGVSILMYHGVSLDEVIAELPAGKASYDEPHRAMAHLLKKRHVAPQFGGRNRHAPEPRDWLVVEDIPDVFHAGHVHKIGVGTYHGVRTVNSGCWQAQTTFQRSVNIDPDVGYAPILDLDTLDVTLRKFV